METKTEIVTVTQTKYVYPSDNLLTPCPEQKPLTLHTNGEMLMSLIELSTDYAICSSRMQSVITYVNAVKLQSIDLPETPSQNSENDTEN